MPQKHKQVFVVEDHPVFCDGLVALFNHDPGLHVQGSANNALDTLNALSVAQPDILIVDIGLPDRSGFQLIEEVTRKWPQLAILVLSMADETTHARRAMRAGAKGYLMKHEAPARLLEAVHQVLEGRTVLSAEMTTKLLSGMQKQALGKSPVEQLSPREREILAMIGEGKTTRTIARQLGVSLKTVDSYRGFLKRKLGIADGHELICFAVRARLNEREAAQAQPQPR